jgi:hypothetical protein
VLAKLHQGTHSADAFTNNLHEIAFRARCNDGTEVNVTFLTANGPGGEMTRRCDIGAKLQVGEPNPTDSPRQGHPLAPGRSMGTRFIPDRWCVENGAPNVQFSEVWKTQNLVASADNKKLFQFSTYFFVTNPSRFLDLNQPSKVGRQIDACYEQIGGQFRFERGTCAGVRQALGSQMVDWNDPRSPFTGTKRGVRFNSLLVRNPGSVTTWYTDPFGLNASPTPFPGSVQQHISNVDHHMVRSFNGPVIGGDYAGHGVHAPN